MKSEEAIKMMNKVQTETVDEFGVMMLQVASTANTMIKARITEKGLNAEGAKFPDYSPRYKKFREAKGRQTSFVDFAFTGNMWSNVKVVSSDSEHKKGLARISTTTQDAEDKLSGNTEKKGTILDLNKEEINELSKQMEDALVEIWHKNGL
jgi:hypothetical protein